MAVDELREAARAAGLDQEDSAAGEYVCPEPGCGRVFDRAVQLANHRRVHGAPAGKAGASRERAGAPAGALPSGFKTELDRAVTNTLTAGALVANFMPHLGVAIAGVQDPATGQWVVRSRAMVAGTVLAGHAAGDAERAAQILRLLRAYNRLFEGSAALDVVAALGAATAADVVMIRAGMAGVGQAEAAQIAGDIAVRLPMVGEIRVVQAAIPDVVQFVQTEMIPPAPAPAAANGHRRRRRSSSRPEPEAAEGGVEET